MPANSVVFGAGGFIGRSLVGELLRRDQHVAAAVHGSGDRLLRWLDEQRVDTGRLTVVPADITRPGLGLPEHGLDEVRDVYNTAARFAFGMTPAEARPVNVEGAGHVVDWAAARPRLRRLVHISGYRMAAAEAASPDYRRDGAYEASKREGDAVVRARARELGVPLSVANPSTVIGPGQSVGLADLVGELWRGRLVALPGGPDIFLPVVVLDYFVQFLASLPERRESADGTYWLLDDATPELPRLVALFAEHMGVRAPRRSVPVGVVKRLPRSLTRANPETLSFLSSDRYDTASARDLADSFGLEMPPVRDALRDWADDLVATRFGRVRAPRAAYGFQQVGADRTWVVGERERPGFVFLHGLPIDADSWSPVAERVDTPALAADLPGFGRSTPEPRQSHDDWLAALLAPVRSRPVLVAHSYSCGPALRYALRYPERVAALVLVSPAFLQPASSWLMRSPLAVPVLSRMTAERLAGSLGLSDDTFLHGPVDDLRRSGAALRVVSALRAAYGHRGVLRSAVHRVAVPVELVIGSQDPLEEPGELPVTEIASAGHYPQLTHPDEVARHLVAVRERTTAR
ncbi:alpha/beta fold hydrolase [Streptomyces sp. NBC_00385]|uniref:alpha/beta fold hydrolase n=1 Tax=Streptomyces sp. NBC_00385 TaxID=2975733 RepID=UPI002DDC47CC|nr:alpha/beta fold hydrolase [Streptomyces sp. NBC_00385]WRZ07297.1 alpha/beta fold hydrolase [Streptomyces sp. NBC_00385]